MNILSRQYLRIFKQSLPKSNTLCGLERLYCYKSAYSLDKLYPKSSLKLFTPEFIPTSDHKFSGFIPMDKIDITYSSSSGPGGQNVNRVNTKVDVRFHVKKATWLSEDLKVKLEEKNKTRISKEGFLIVKSEVTRSQQLNLADALEKLRKIIREAEKPEVVLPSPETEEVLRKRQMKIARERILVKRMKSERKEERGSVKPSDIL